MLASHERESATRISEVLGLSWTSELLHGDHAPVQSLDQLGVLAARVGQHRWPWLLVHSTDDAHRFVHLTCGLDGVQRVDVGAVVGDAARHTLWRLESALDGRVPAEHFTEIARNWFGLGVLPGWTATRIDHAGIDDEPF